MTTTTKTLEVKIYCGTYGKYNDGNLFGEWIDLTDMDKEEFYEACFELHQNEVDPELMFQDYESNSEALKSMIDEGGIDKDFWTLKEALKIASDNDAFTSPPFIYHTQQKRQKVATRPKK